jgi:ribonuclease HII
VNGGRQQGLDLFGDGPLAGVDEAGRGPLAGPVVAAAVILDTRAHPPGLADSKVLSEQRREALAGEIRAHARAWAVAWAEPAEIDALNILQATLLAMRRAVEGLSLKPAHVQVDGNRCPRLAGCTVEAVIRGDALVPAISAASILAKVTRDQWMRRSHRHWPDYGFDRHKGYGTAAHMAALDRDGPCAIHRRSFGPVQRAVPRTVTR